MILPMVEDVQQINIMRPKENWFYFISEDAEIENLLEDIRELTNKKKVDSVNETPVNVEDYFVFEIHEKTPKENPLTFYLYHNKGYYLEKPYEGIWKISKNSYSDLLEKIEYKK